MPLHDPIPLRRSLDLKVVSRPLAELRGNPRNARVHSKKQVRQIADSINRFGFVNPVLIDADDRIIAGHGRAAAAKLLGIDSVPTVRLDHLSEVEKRAYVIADNRLAELASWDKGLLAIELGELGAMNLDFDLTITGFDEPEIDLLLQNGVPPPDPDDTFAPPDLRAPAVTRPGDLWQLGPHRLLCGDARDASAYARLMDNDRARLVFTDPPYNVPINGHVMGLGAVKHAEFAMASGEMSRADFTRFLSETLGNMAAVSIDGALNYVCMDWRHMGEVLGAGRNIYAELKNLCVWNKSNAGMGSLYRSKHELIFVFKVGTAPHINSVQLGKFGRHRTNVWDYAGQTTFHVDRDADLAAHPTVKPVQLVADAILDASHRGDVVLDGFSGAGTILLAAERTGRRARAIEIDPYYVDVAIRRWQQATGEVAIHAESGHSFAAVAEAAAPKSNSDRAEAAHV